MNDPFDTSRDHEIAIGDAEQISAGGYTWDAVENALPEELRPYPTESAKFIIQKLLPKWREQFIAKSAQYGDMANVLGAKEQFADMNRKFWPLKRALWDGKTLPGEQPEEILLDMIGHCFLTLMFLENERNSR